MTPEGAVGETDLVSTVTALPSAEQDQAGAGFVGAGLFLLNMSSVPVLVSIAFLLPSQISAPLLLLGYGSIAMTERRQGVSSPISLTMALVALTLIVASWVPGFDQWMALTPVVVFAGLFAIGSVCLLLGRPMTTFIAGNRGLKALHWVTSGLWTAIYGIAMVTSAFALYQPVLYPLPLLLVYAGVALTLYLHLRRFHSRFERAKSFELGRFTFHQCTGDELPAFYRHFVCEALPNIRAGSGPREESLERLIALKTETDQSSWSRTTFFLASEGDRIIGTIACVIDDPVAGLGVETDHNRPFGLDRMRAVGRIVEIGKFSISKEHRWGQDVIRGLFRCAIEYAMEKGATFLTTQAFNTALPMYRKIGFVPLLDRPVPQKGTGIAIVPAILNLQRKAAAMSRSDEGKQLRENLTPYVPERYAKRSVLTSLFSRRPAWRMTDAELLALIDWRAPTVAATQEEKS